MGLAVVHAWNSWYVSPVFRLSVSKLSRHTGWTLIFISLIGFWVVEQCKSVLLASNAHQPEPAPSEEHDTSLGSEPFAVPMSQEVEHTEAASLPAGV